MIANKGFAFGTKEKLIAIIITHAVIEENSDLDQELVGEIEGKEEHEAEPTEEIESTAGEEEKLEDEEDQFEDEL